MLDVKESKRVAVVKADEDIIPIVADFEPAHGLDADMVLTVAATRRVEIGDRVAAVVLPREHLACAERQLHATALRADPRAAPQAAAAACIENSS